MGQGNPAIARHPMTPAQCREKLERKRIDYENPEFERICGAKYMAPLYDPAERAPEQAKACIDQFEFPDIPCEYPVVWVKAREAAEICAAQGKRLCDAHEWEGACQGSLEPPDYRFDLAAGVSPNAAVERMRAAHNRAYAASKRWSYGPEYQRGVCAARQLEDARLRRRWLEPVRLEHLSGRELSRLPQPARRLRPERQRGRAHEPAAQSFTDVEPGSTTLGYTEMKGSWFIFDTYRAHEDWCRWRAPYWHGSRVMDPHSHANYHLGFRCCKTLEQR